ncbi:PE family protein [Mycobacterium hubeiense]|uniref:PE family protein n=1 Tax=Mycobacterium hubeiense TaxID=1867256 RepID=UPI000C7F3B7E|nr:PE family protein [Mycobacterium sp. QGD 101]
MDIVGVETPVVTGVAANLLAQAVTLQSAIIAATPATTAIVPPGAEEVSATGAAMFTANNAEALAMAQTQVANLVSAATEVGGAAVAFEVQDLVGKGLLLV